MYVKAHLNFVLAHLSIECFALRITRARVTHVDGKMSIPFKFVVSDLTCLGLPFQWSWLQSTAPLQFVHYLLIARAPLLRFIEL